MKKIFNKSQAKAWMQRNKKEYIDPKTGEVYLTAIVEDCCDFFDQKDLDGPLDDPDHWIWEVPLNL